MNLTPVKRQRAGASWTKILLVALWLFVGLILLSPLSVFLELACHFTLHAILFGSVLLFVSLWQSLWKSALATCLPLLYLIFLLQPQALWLGQPPPARTSRVKILSWNVLCLNERLEEIKQVIVSEPSDILVLIEVRPNLLEQIPEIAEHYPHHLVLPSWGGNGIAVLSRNKDVSFERVEFSSRSLPSIVATVRDAQNGREVKLVALHTWSPMPPQRAVPRDKQLLAMTDWARRQSSPLCVVGDLNTTPWTPGFRRLESAGFIDSRTSGFGNSASWPSWLGPLGIPIDHALSYGECHFVRRDLGPWARGSDHRPLVLELTY